MFFECLVGHALAGERSRDMASRRGGKGVAPEAVIPAC
jgi:hypothetical protein